MLTLPHTFCTLMSFHSVTFKFLLSHAASTPTGVILHLCHSWSFEHSSAIFMIWKQYYYNSTDLNIGFLTQGPHDKKVMLSPTLADFSNVTLQLMELHNPLTCTEPGASGVLRVWGSRTSCLLCRLVTQPWFTSSQFGRYTKQNCNAINCSSK